MLKGAREKKKTDKKKREKEKKIINRKEKEKQKKRRLGVGCARAALSIERLPSLSLGDKKTRFASHQKIKVHICQTCRGKKRMIGPASADVRKYFCRG